MSQLIVNIQDKVISQMFAYTAKHQISFDEMTEKLWVDFLSNQAQHNSADNDFFELLDNTKCIWKNGNDL